MSSSKPIGDQTSAYHLVLNQPQFLRQARTLLVDRQDVAFGRVRRRTTRQAQEMILDQWDVRTLPPSGQELPPMMDWAVLGVANESTPKIEDLVKLVHPKRSQSLVVIQLEPENRERFPVAIWQNDKLQYPDEVIFVGSQMLRLGSAASTSTLHLIPKNDRNAERTSVDGEPESAAKSQIQLPLRSSRTAGALGDLFRRIGDMRVVLVGAGGGGQELARQLVAAGVRQLTLIDHDSLEPENLDRMPLAKVTDIGQAKATQLAHSLHENQPDLSVSVLPNSMHDADVTRYLRSMRADVLFSYVDSQSARLAVSLAAREMETIHIDVGSTVQNELGQRAMAGDIRLFEPRQGCVVCVPKLENLPDVLYRLAAPSGSLERGKRLNWDDQRAGSLLHLNAFTSAIAVEYWLAWLNGSLKTSHWTRVRWTGTTPDVHSASVAPQNNCQFCNPTHE